MPYRTQDSRDPTRRGPYELARLRMTGLVQVVSAIVKDLEAPGS